jgi:hypothetical protein
VAHAPDRLLHHRLRDHQLAHEVHDAVDLLHATRIDEESPLRRFWSPPPRRLEEAVLLSSVLLLRGLARLGRRPRRSP